MFGGNVLNMYETVYLIYHVNINNLWTIKSYLLFNDQ